MIPTVTVESLIQRAKELALSGSREILGITGAPGAGKSTLAAQLVDALGADLAVLVPMDGFHLANSLLEDRGLRQVKGAVQTFDDAGFANLLHRIKNQKVDETIYAPHFDRDLEESIAGAIPVLPGTPLVITEGNYILADEGQWPSARGMLTESWFLEPADDTRIQRLIHRHIAHGKTEQEAQRWALGSDEQNAKMIQATAAKADRIIRVSSARTRC
ncbi:MAG: coaE 1 [Arthrobacter sp.]|nr:coaE 1 [Arthrobacter sp.]